MRTLKSVKLLFLAIFVILLVLPGCKILENTNDDIDIATQPPQTTDANGRVNNRPNGKTFADEEKAVVHNKNMEIIQNAPVVVVPDEGKAVYVTNTDGKFCGILFNPQSDLSQDYEVKYDGDVIYAGTIKPKHMKRIFSFHNPGVDKICIKWTMGNYCTTVEVPFPEGPAIFESPMGDPCHFHSHGFGIDGYTPQNYSWQF